MAAYLDGVELHRLGSFEVRDEIFAKRYGLRSSEALPLCGSKGTEACSWAIVHLPPVFRKQMVARHYISIFFPFVIVPVTRLRQWQKATSTPAVMLRLRIS